MKKENIYLKTRKDLKLTREKASELTGKVKKELSPDRIEKIESDKITPQAYDTLALAEAYNKYELCNHHCAHVCPIGQKFTPEIKVNTLEKITLELLSSVNATIKKKDRLIDIAADGIVDDDELEDFIKIQEDLNKISMTVDTLKLWAEEMVSNGTINKKKYDKLKSMNSELTSKF